MNKEKDIQQAFWKRFLRRLLILLAMLFLIFQAAQLWQYFNTGADQSEILFKTFGQVKQATHYVQWSGEKPEGAALDEYSMKKIGETYSEAWNAWNTYLATQREEVLQDYFADSLVSRMTVIPANHRIERAALSHQLEPVLFSLDKQVLVFYDRGVSLYRQIYNGEEMVGTDSEVADFLVVMALIEGKWYVKYIKKMPPGEEMNKKLVSENVHELRINDTGFISNGISIDINGVNYYPQFSPWTRFWSEYIPDTIRIDLKVMGDLGINAVRIFIPYFNVTEDTLSVEKLAAIQSFLDLSRAAGIFVMPTLFDFPKSYEVADYPAFDAYLKKILSLASDYGHVLAWDIKNEVDLDVRHYGEEKVVAWLNFVIDRCRYYDPSRLLTIGWSDPVYGHILSDRLDFVSFHFYQDAGKLKEEINSLQKAIGSKKQLVLSEFGRPSFDPWWFPPGYSQEEQAEYAGNILAGAGEDGVTTFYWCLYDYPELPPGIFGWKPWIKGMQKRFGIIDEKGNPKPVANSISDSIRSPR